MSSTLLAVAFFPHFVHAVSRNLINFMDGVEDVVEKLAKEVGADFDERCDEKNLRDCHESQHNLCLSEMGEKKECPSANSGTLLHNANCGDGRRCNAYVDYGGSAVSIPPTEQVNDNFTPLDPTVTETICLGQRYDSWIRQGPIFQDIEDLFHDSAAGSEHSEAPFLYFGASDGVFRMYPARPWGSCDYDPRKRTWYVAASSTPKVVVIVLDISSYPKTEDFEYAKKTASAFVQAMASADRVSIVFMGDTPEIAEVGDVLVSGDEQDVVNLSTDQVKDTLWREIGNRTMSSTPDADAEGAFHVAFDLLEKTIDADYVHCHTAVVLLTIERNLALIPTDRIVERKQKIEDLTGRTLLFFGYNAGTELTASALSLECSLGAVWSILDSSRGDRGIVQNVRLFHEAFAFDLGRTFAASDGQPPTDIARWSDLYEFHPLGITGTTVAAPVFHLQTSPPLFLGVVGVSLSLRMLEEAVKPNNVSEAVMEILRRQLQPRCGASFSRCDLEALRLRSRRFMGTLVNGSAAICENDHEPCKEMPVLDRSECPAQTTTMPSSVWHNVDRVGADFSVWACCDPRKGGVDGDLAQCSIGDNATSNVVMDVTVVGDDGTRKAVIVGIAVAIAIVLGMVTATFIWYRPEDRGDSDGGNDGGVGANVPNADNGEAQGNVIASSVAETSVSPITNPSFQTSHSREGEVTNLDNIPISSGLRATREEQN